MYENLIETLRFCAKNGDCHDCPYEKSCAGTMGDGLYCEAADAIEEMSHQRDRAYARLCEWCGVCPEEKRNPEDCEIAALNPEPPKEET